MLTATVTETRRLSPHAFMYEGTPDIPEGLTILEHRRAHARPRSRWSAPARRLRRLV